MSEVRPEIPYSKDAEEALLGAVIIDPNLVIQVKAIIDADDFYVERNRWIWDAVESLLEKDMTPDAVTLSEELEHMQRLSTVGGSARIAQLVSYTPNSQNAVEYARIIADKAKRRQIIRTAAELVRQAYDADSKLDAAVAKATDEISMQVRPAQGAKPIITFATEVYDEVVERAKNPVDVWGIPTGFKDLDYAIGGLQLSESLYIAGEPGVGKSKLCNQLGINMALPEQGENGGAIYSLEMKGKSVVRRSMSMLANVATRHLKTGKLLEGEWDKFTMSLKKHEQLPVWLNDNTDLTVNELRAELEMLKRKHAIKWFVLDYLMLLSGYEHMRDDTERSAMLSSKIRAIARSLDLACITVNSVTKEYMDRGKYGMAGLRGSGSIIHDADLIGFLVKDDDRKIVSLKMVKTRDTETTFQIDLVPDASVPIFHDAESEQASFIPGELSEPLLVKDEWWNK